MCKKCEDTINAVYLFQCTPVFQQMLRLVPHGAFHAWDLPRLCNSDGFDDVSIELNFDMEDGDRGGDWM